MIEVTELSNREALLHELEKLKKGTESEKLNAILETLFKLLILMASTSPTPPEGRKPAPQMIG
jgi:hypothetical protein